MWKQFNESWDNLVSKLEGWLDGIITNLPNIILAVLVMSVAFFLSTYIKKIAQKGLRKATKNDTVTGVLSNIATAAFMLLSLFLVLGILNLDKALTSLLAGAGVVGLAIGLALQDPMVNLFSGVLMSVRDYYSVGDLVATNGFEGKIKSINLRSTIIDLPDGQEVIIPNKDVLQNPLKNYSHTPRRRIEVNCGVAYNDDLEKVKDTVVNAIENNIEFIDSKPVALYFTEFGDSSINFTVHFWQRIVTHAEYKSARSKAIIAIKKALDKEGFTIPFPIRTLDFGVEGGVRIDDIYPKKALLSSTNGNGEN